MTTSRGRQVLHSDDDDGDLYAVIQPSPVRASPESPQLDVDSDSTEVTSEDHFAFLDKLDLVTPAVAAEMKKPAPPPQLRRSQRLLENVAGPVLSADSPRTRARTAAARLRQSTSAAQTTVTIQPPTEATPGAVTTTTSSTTTTVTAASTSTAASSPSTVLSTAPPAAST